MKEQASAPRVVLDPRGKVDENTRTIPLAGIRRAFVYLQGSKDTRSGGHAFSELSWYASAWGVPDKPELDFEGAVAPVFVNLAPSRVEIPPLGAALMLVLVAYLPPVPSFKALGCAFVAEGHQQPSGKAIAWGHGDRTPHDFAGLFLCPFGDPQTKRS